MAKKNVAEVTSANPAAGWSISRTYQNHPGPGPLVNNPGYITRICAVLKPASARAFIGAAQQQTTQQQTGRHW